MSVENTLPRVYSGQNAHLGVKAGEALGMPNLPSVRCCFAFGKAMLHVNTHFPGVEYLGGGGGGSYPLPPYLATT